MSARWWVRIVCDNCGRRSDATEADRVTYGPVLAAVRAGLARVGWDTWKAGRSRRDHCPRCARGRA